MYNRMQISLDGTWQWGLTGDEINTIDRKVPGSYRCVGQSVYSRHFTWSVADGVWDLCFEGIAYEGEVYLNGEKIGEMEPYSFYRFDVTNLLRDGDNCLLVVLQDITAVFGPVNGWRNYSGIIRGVYLEQKPVRHLEDVFFHYTFAKEYQWAICCVDVCLGGTVSSVESIIKVTLMLRDEVITRISGGGNDAVSLQFQIEKPELWSPDMPTLYTLVVESDNGDIYKCQVGFKDFCAENDRFMLNGKPLFLMGVCHHELWEDEQGHTLSVEQMERDMRMIKEMGANFVRLVHYPHNRYFLELADKYGLLVSEEPGFWWSNVQNDLLVDRGLEVLRRVIVRDRNHVSVAFWLSFNECILTVDFLRKAVQLTRRTDPTRLVSGANCMCPKETKEMFDEAGCDFYTYHPYGTDKDHITCGVDSRKKWDGPLQTLENVCRIFSGKPTIFTEWGGYYLTDEPRRLREYCAELFRLADSKPNQPTLAGASYWVWADYYEDNRPQPSSYDGVTVEGLTDMWRTPRIGYQILKEMIADRRSPREAYPGVVEWEQLPCAGEHLPVALPSNQSVEQVALWEKVTSTYTGSIRSRPTHALRGPVFPRADDGANGYPFSLREGAPLVITKESPLILEINEMAKAILFVGQTILTGGYPRKGRRGELMGEYRLTFADGTCQTIPLCNGEEISAAACLHGSTRIEPMATRLQKIATIMYDPSFEIYTLQLLRHELKTDANLIGCTLTVCQEEEALLLYGVLLEK